MDGDRLREEEAAQVVAFALDARFECRDRRHPPAIHDFDILRSDGSREALEVTQLSDSSERRLYGAMGRHGTKLRVAQLKRCWSLWLENEAKVKRLNALLPSLLIDLETRGVHDVHHGARHRHDESVRTMLDGLHIQSGWSYPSAKLAGNVYLLPSYRASYVNPDEVVPVATEALADAGNLSKLSNSGFDRRHLFLWIDPTRYPAWEGICSGHLPRTPLAVPVEVTDVWIGARCMNGEHTVWRFCDGEWEVVIGGEA